MFGLEKVITTLVPVLAPPYVLMREEQFPNCPKIFEEIAQASRKSKLLGKRFSILCRLTGLVWVIWAFNLFLFSSGTIMLVYHWGRNLDMSEAGPFGLSCRMIIAVIASLLFVGSMGCFGMRTISLQLADNCYEIAKAGSRQKAPANKVTQDSGSLRNSGSIRKSGSLRNSGSIRKVDDSAEKGEQAVGANE
jgi:hypothetical protein